MVFPVMQGALEKTRPVIRDLEDNPALKSEFEAWRDRRAEFMTKFEAGDAQTLKQAWQRFYFLGKLASTGEQVASHASKIRLDMPLDQRHRNGPATGPAAQPISQLGMQEARRADSQPAPTFRAKRKAPKARGSGE
jgi:hypothetical protein